MRQTEINKRLARRWLELVSRHRVEELCAMTAPEWMMRGGPPSLPCGAAGVREMFRAAGPVKQRWIVEDMIAEDDRVVVRAFNYCEQESFCGLSGKGVVQKFSATFIFRFRDGLVVDTWRHADDLGRVLQLGGRITPAPRAAAYFS